ncbi:MAG TPA: PQQ-dependent sugar dehydrogenase, partial [Adhaeribacter sp.]|nr:PQQ-dependent sugar dehydrogenase [Adhaeribacter sp.]
MKKLVSIFLLLAGLALESFGQFQVGQVTVTASTLAANLHVPWELVWGPDNFIWMAERNGRISRVDPATGQVTPLITVTEVQQSGESGMLGLALHPGFSQNPYVFVVYTYSKNGQLTEKLVRFTYTGTTLTSPQVLLDDIPAATLHVGSR